MKRSFHLIPAVILLGSCSSMTYRLTPAHAGRELTLKGTVLAVEEDGDFLLETDGRLAFVDVGDTNREVEMGDQVMVSGTVEHDAEESEAPELDASKVSPLN